MSACRIIDNPETGIETQSKTWESIRNEVGNDQQADELYSKLETENFRQFFGDWVNNPETSSMVKDDTTGEPILLYHASTKKFEEFNNKFSREVGFHFGTEKSAVERHFPGGIDNLPVDIKDVRADLKTEIDDFTMYPVFLNIRNMIEGADYLEADKEIGKITIPIKEYDELYKDGRAAGLNEETTKLAIAFYQKGIISKQQVNEVVNGDDLLRDVINADGYWYTNMLENKGEKSYVVFDENNIKSLYNIGTYSTANNIYKQSNLESSEAKPQTLQKFKEFAERLNLKGKYLNNMVIDGRKINAQGVADIAKGLYYILEGKQSTAEPEEIMHFAVEALEESEPKLFNSMLSKIGSYNIYRKTFQDYSEDIAYLNEDGTPNIRKIKKEAIAKLLVETVIKQNEGLTEKPELLAQTLSWWDQIKQWFTNLIKKAQFNPFEEAASKLDTLKSEENTFNLDGKTFFFHASKIEIKGNLSAGKESNKFNAFGDAIYFATDESSIKELGKYITKVNLSITNPLYSGSYDFYQVSKLASERKISISEAAKSLGYDSIIEKDSPIYGNEVAVLDESKIIYPKDILKPTTISKKDVYLQIKKELNDTTGSGEIRPNDRKLNEGNIGEDTKILLKSPISYQYNNKSTGGLPERKGGPIQIGLGRRWLTTHGLSISNFSEFKGKTYEEVFSDRGLSEMERGIYALLRIKESFEGNKFNKRIKDSLQINNINLIENEEKGPIFVDAESKDITLNLSKLGRYFDKAFEKGKDLDKLTDTVVSEELIHKIAIKITSPELWRKSITEIRENPKLDEEMEKYYKGFNRLKSYQKSQELIRVKVQKEILGYTTEDIGHISAANEILNNVWNWLKDLFFPEAKNTTLIAENVKDYINNGGEKVEDNSFNQDLGASYTPKQEEITSKLLSESSKIIKVHQENTEKVLGTEEEASNFYEYEGQKVPNRVTDRVKNWYNNIPFFRNKKFTAEEEEMNNIKREFGISGHNGFESVVNRYFDGEGNKLDKVLDKPQVSPIQDDANFRIYDKLENYLLGLVKQHPDSKVFSEVMIYDPKYTTKKGKGEAGTIDLLIVDSDGKVNIYDWKFMGDNPNQVDVASYKQGAYDVQLSRYRDILKENYGVTKFGKVRAIPITMSLKQKGDEITFSGIGIGSADPKQVDKVKLLPVPTLTERTDIPEVNRILDKLSALYQKVQGEKVKPEERINKRERLSVLKDAIRQIQTKENLTPLLDSMRLHIQSFEDTLNTYNSKFKDQDLGKYSTKEKSDFADDLNELRDLVNFYSNVSVELEEVFKGDDNLFAEIVALENRIRSYEHKFFSISNQDSVYNKFADQLGHANNVLDLLRPEKIVKGLSKIFTSLEDLPNKALNLLVNLYNEAKQKAVDTTTEHNEELFKIVEKVNKNHSGNAFTKLIKSDRHELIDEFDSKFFQEFRKAKEDKKAKQFVKDNIDLEGYKKEADEYIKQQEKKIDEEPAIYADKKQEEKRKEEKKEFIRNKYSVDSNEIGDNHIIKKYIDSKWQSKEFKELHQPGNEDLLEFYHKVIEINHIAYDAGYIEYNQIRTFLPFMAASLKDNFTFSKILHLPFNFFDSLSRNDQAQFGYINPVSGNKNYTLPKYFTSDITKKVDKEGNVTHDLAKVSKELGQSMLLYTQAIMKYKYMSEIESQIKLIQNVEGLKQHIETNNFNNPVFDKETGEVSVLPGNKDNEAIFDKFTQYLIYGNKYPLSTDADTGVNKAVNIVKRGINKTFNTHLEENSTPSSLIKTIDAINRGFQLKTLGGNIFSGMVNWFGGNMQALAQDGEYYPVKDFVKAEWKLKRLLDENYWGDKEKDVFIQLLSEFKPLSEGSTYELFKKANSSATGRFHFSDVMMAFMRRPEILMQAATFEAVMYNTMVEGGHLVNITDFVKNKYSDRYSSTTNLKESKVNIQEEINKLKAERSLIKTAKIIDDKLVIEGLDNFKDEVRKYSILTQRIYRKLTGSISDTAINMAKLDVYTSSMMVFKNWIPKLAYTRFQSLQKVNDPIRENNYEIGRIRLLMGTLFDKQIGSVRAIYNILRGNEKGLVSLDLLYEKYANSYEKSTGQRFTMDENDFKDMIVKNMGNQIRELGILAGIMSSIFALGFLAPPDDDKQAKSGIALLIRTLDKFRSELSFFYNPMEIQQMLSGGMFPALGLFSDIDKVLVQAQRQFTGYDFRDPYKDAEQVRQEAQPIKFALKLVPGASAWLTWLTVISPDLSKELDIKTPNKNSNY